MHITYRLPETVEILSFDERQVLFSEARQQLMELNDVAAHLVGALRHGATFRSLVDSLVTEGAPPDAAEDWVRQALLAWAFDDLVIAEIGPAGEAGGGLDQSLAIAGLAITIRYGSDALRDSLAGAFHHLETEAAPDAPVYQVIEGDDFVLLGKAGEAATIVEPAQALPALKARLFQDAIAEPSALAAFHTACIVDQGQAILLEGPSGIGKSTLTIALSAAGFGYAADDVILLRRDGRVQGVPFAPTAKEGSWPLLQALGLELHDYPVHKRLDDVLVRYVLPGESLTLAPLPVRLFIKLQRQENRSATLVPMSRTDALGALLHEGFTPSKRASVECMRVLTGALTQTACFQLYYSDLSEAVSLLRNHVNDGSGISD